MLKGSREGGEVFAFDALRCDNSHTLGRHSGRRFCGEGRIQVDNGMTIKALAGELSIHTAAGTGNPLPSDFMQEEAVNDEGGMRGILAQ